MQPEIILFALGALIGYSLKKEKVVYREMYREITLNDALNYIYNNFDSISDNDVRTLTEMIVKRRYDTVKDLMKAEIIDSGVAEVSITEESPMLVGETPFSMYYAYGSSPHILNKTCNVYAFDGIMLDIQTRDGIDAEIYIDGSLVDTLSYRVTDKPIRDVKFYEVSEGVHTFEFRCGEMVGLSTYTILPGIKSSRTITFNIDVSEVEVEISGTDKVTWERVAYASIMTNADRDIYINDYWFKCFERYFTDICIPLNKPLTIETDGVVGIGLYPGWLPSITLRPANNLSTLFYWMPLWGGEGGYTFIPPPFYIDVSEARIPYVMYNIPLRETPAITSAWEHAIYWWQRSR